RSLRVSYGISSWRPSHLPLPRPVIAKHSPCSTKYTSRGVVSSATCAARRRLSPLCALAIPWSSSPLPAKTVRPDARARGNPYGFSLPHPERHVQAARCCVCGPLQRAAQAVVTGEHEGRATGGRRENAIYFERSVQRLE